MDCEQFIEQTCTDPAYTDAALQTHESECPACAAWAARARAAEALIHAALRFDVARIRAEPPRGVAWGSLAAAAIAGFTVWFGLAAERQGSTGELISEVLAHWDHEPAALLPGERAVSESSLEDVLAGEATIDLTALGLAAAGQLTYARKCIVAGQWMSHLVVQSGSGPVTILLAPQHSVDVVFPIEHAERRLGGGLFPTGTGAIAVFGEGDAANAALARRIAATIDLSI